MNLSTLKRLKLDSPSMKRKSSSVPNSPNLKIPIPIIFKKNNDLNTTIVLNYIPICHRLHRDPKHVLIYLNKVVNLSGEIIGSQLRINGDYKSKQLRDIFKRYCQLFIMCRHCNLYNTRINSDKKVECQNCKFKFFENL